jgi:hypothetical protein
MAILVGLFVIAPQLFFINRLGSEYQGLYLMNTDAETHYVARIQEVYDGQGTGNPYIHEYKDLPSPLYTYSETVLAYPGMLLGISATTMNLVYKFFLPLIIALLAYLLIWRMTHDRLWSITGTILLMLGYSLINMPDIIHLLRLDVYYTDLVMYSRPVNPQLSSIFLFVYLHIMLSVFNIGNAEDTSRRSLFIVLGVIFGLSFYVYLYSFTFFLALNVVSILYFVCMRTISKTIALVASSLIGCVIGIFFIIHMLKVMHSPYYGALADILGLAQSHAPIISLAGIITLGIFLLHYWKSTRTPTDTFILVLLLTTFVVVNQQVITGVALQTGHYHWYFNSPIYFMTLIYVAYRFFRYRYTSLGIVCAACIIAVSIADATFIQYSAYNASVVQTTEHQRYSEVFQWLNKNTVPGSVVFAHAELSELIPLFTSNDIVWFGPAEFYLLPPERIAFNQQNIIAANFDVSTVGGYQLDYVVFDARKDSTWDIRVYDRLKLLDSVGDFTFYKYDHI